jgi:hypothetical protein
MSLTMINLFIFITKITSITARIFSRSQTEFGNAFIDAPRRTFLSGSKADALEPETLSESELTEFEN